MLLTIKALHIIGVVVWFSGLFYIGRLFVYHQEANDRSEVERQVLIPQYELMEKRLWYAITNPGMIVTVLAGGSLLQYSGFPTWLHVKLVIVAILIGYHYVCGHLRKQLLAGTCSWSSKRLRMFNEIPSLLLIMIVFIVVLKGQLSWSIFLLSIIGVALLMGAVMQVYNKIRKRNNDHD